VGAPQGWKALTAELNAWARDGAQVQFWWRDDDAARDVPALARLLALAEEASVPLALAVVPAALEPAAARRIAGCPWASVLQHGWAHRNHAGPSGRKTELAGRRPPRAVLAELLAGRDRLGAAFAEGALPVLVPPWNRIAPALLTHLPSLGFVGLSTFAGRHWVAPCFGLRRVETHVDLIDWRGGRRFCGEERALALIVQQLRAHREGTAAGAEPIGLLTHHLVTEASGWSFLARLFRQLGAHPAARWRAAPDLFAVAGGCCPGQAARSALSGST
jgi:hypothetical protein